MVGPCKKRRKDDDSSSCETITKYLSPKEKTGDKVFSPPKPSNILHYFRKTSPTNEKLQLTTECTIKPPPSLLVGNSKDHKTPLEMLSNTEFKKKGKRVNLSHQLNDIKIQSLVGISSDSKEDCGLSDFVESSTDVFLYKKDVEVLAESIQDRRNQPSTITSKKNFQKVNPKKGTTKNDGKMLRKRKHSKVLDLSESLPLADDINLLKKGGKDSKPSLANENERTANHVDSRACATKTTDLNKSTITVSYEEFLKSQKAARVEEIPDSAVPACVPPGSGETVKSSSEGESESCEFSPRVHLKTVTVLAQVHPTPPKKKGKIAQIFLKQKQLDLESSLSDPENEQTVQKRKSNVVIQEGQLELAVLEAGSSEASVPKCSMEERQQFMRAFRQPPPEMLKNGLKKPLEKQKDPNEKSANEEGDNGSEKIIENPNIQIVSNPGSSQTHTGKASFPKEESKKPKKKGKKTVGTRTTPGGNSEESMQKEETSFSSKDKQKQNSLRRSLRQKSEVFKSNLLFNSESLVCEDTAHDSLKMSQGDRNKSRKPSTSIQDMVTHSEAEPENRLLNVSTPKRTRSSIRGSSTPTVVTLRDTESEDGQDTHPVKASTPKAANISEKHSLYTAELITIPSDSESPISTSKNVSKAKQLIEKAKAFRVIGSKAEETVVPLRRSSRHQAPPEREKSPETDDSVILIDSSPTIKQPEKNQKKLKNLNDVLGKKVNKPSKNVPGYWLWHLKPPSCPMLTEFKELNTKVTDLSKCVVALGEFSTLNSNPRSNSAVVSMRTRNDFTKEVRNLLLEEINLQLQLHVNQKESKRKCVETGNQKSKRKKPNEYLLSPEKIQKSEDLDKRISSSGINLDSSKDSSDTDFKGSSDDEECHLCNTVLITGPTGVGKTAAVYACAQELGFKRSGRQILSQLKEATQSHQVDKQGVNSQKPCFFNNYNIGKSPKKLNSPGKVVTSPRKLPPSSPKGSKQKRAFPPKTLANYFKVSSKSKNNEDAGVFMGNNKEFGAEESNKKNATSLILFEEVDVIFDEDAGFLNAVKTFMATTKRPVVLTTSDPTFSLVFDGCFEEINFNIPSLLNVASYLQVICLVENFRTDLKDFVTLLTANACDIRKSILYLQFWIRSGEGNSRNIPVCSEDGSDLKTNSKNSRRSRIALPKCDTGCAEALFGLRNITSPSQDLISCLKHKITTKEEWHKFIQLLTEFHMQNIDLLYNNLEFILPLPVTVIPEVKDAHGFPVTTEASAPGSMENLPRMKSEDQPLKKSQKRKQKKMVTLDDSDLFDTGMDFSDELTSLSPVPSLALEDLTSKDREGNQETQTHNKGFTSDSVPRPPKTPAEKKSSMLVSHCLNSLTEFMENMSFLDAVLSDAGEQNELGRKPFSWTSGKVKSGLCDEFSIESRDGWAPQRAEELKATAEALSFTKCSSTISKARESLNSHKHLERDAVNELTFCVSQRCSDVCFRQSAANLENADKRMAVIKRVLSSRSLLSVGNQQASITDYLPTLRNICRTEKLKEQGRNKRRFLHYFEGIHLDIPEEAVTALAADFP
ncbi:hypothetical protein U0070_003473 [Myodes glareolus]|uniref:AAA+ ATPase domain-containing protein n=1 Tax=Myodes glareolus TaxID=447135 RepID=A0AAW0JUC7_MYOGA